MWRTPGQQSGDWSSSPFLDGLAHHGMMVCRSLALVCDGRTVLRIWTRNELTSSFRDPSTETLELQFPKFIPSDPVLGDLAVCLVSLADSCSGPPPLIPANGPTTFTILRCLPARHDLACLAPGLSPRAFAEPPPTRRQRACPRWRVQRTVLPQHFTYHIVRIIRVPNNQSIVPGNRSSSALL